MSLSAYPCISPTNLTVCRCEYCKNGTQVINHSRENKLGGYNYQLNCRDCYRLGVLDTSADPIFDETTRPIAIVASVFLPLLYIFGLVFSLNSHYRLIEEEEKLIQEEIREMERMSTIERSVNKEMSTIERSVDKEELKENLLSTEDRNAEAAACSADDLEAAAHERAVV